MSVWLDCGSKVCVWRYETCVGQNVLNKVSKKCI